MARAFEEWKVLDHGPLVSLEENLWQVEGEVPGVPIGRHMIVARMSDGRLVIHNGIALGEEGMKELESLGEIAFVLVPNRFHRLDAANFRRRYPKARILCPPGARKKVEEVVEVDGSYADFPDDAAVRLEVLDGIKGAEGVMISALPSGESSTLIFTDTLFNIRHGKGMKGLVFRMLGSTGGPKVPGLARAFMVKDKKALAANLRRLSETAGLRRLIPGHGKAVESDAAQVLRDVAAAL